jgi:ribosomal protein S18 acetylase RimI-like enzyme
MVNTLAQMSGVTLRVTRATLGDLAAVRAIYADGRVRQSAQGSTVWPEFGDDAIRREIDRHQLFLIVEGLALAGVFSVAYEDGAIWGERENGTHVYLHRIVRARTYSGGRIVDAVLEWAEAQCRALGRAGLRMDTWADNRQLIAYYETVGPLP